MAILKPILMGDKEVLPVFEGGKGVGASSAKSAGAVAAAGGVGCVSLTYTLPYNELGKPMPYIFNGKKRNQRHDELGQQNIQNGIRAIHTAHEIANGNGFIAGNILSEVSIPWKVVDGIAQGCQYGDTNLLQGIAAGAGLPIGAVELAIKYQIGVFPIVSSARAFHALMGRSQLKTDLSPLYAVVWECPWKAGGHNGFLKTNDPAVPEDPYQAVLALRQAMDKYGIPHTVPIVIAGGVWKLSDLYWPEAPDDHPHKNATWADWVDDKELGTIAFQFGTRLLATQESPIPESWKRTLFTIDPLNKGEIRAFKKGDAFTNERLDQINAIREGQVLAQQFSPTGFWSNAITNEFMMELLDQMKREVPYRKKAEEPYTVPIEIKGIKTIYVTPLASEHIPLWNDLGYTQAMPTPDQTAIFVTPARAKEIRASQGRCMGCLHNCAFSNWTSEKGKSSTGKLPDPRSFCIIEKLVESIINGANGVGLIFAGSQVHRFKTCPSFHDKKGDIYFPPMAKLIDDIIHGR